MATLRPTATLLLLIFLICLHLVDGVPKLPPCPDGKYIVAMKKGSHTHAILAHNVMRMASPHVSEFHIGSHGHEGFIGKLTPEEVDQLDHMEEIDFIVCNEKVRAFAASDANETVDAASCLKQNESPRHLERLMREEPVYDGAYIYGSKSGRGIDMYILDTGVWTQHPDFGDGVIITENFTEDDGEDNDGHGTHVAGIAASKTYGVAKNANLIGMKVLRDDGTGDFSNVILALEWALARSRATGRRAICNLSLGGKFSVRLNELFNDFVDEGLLIIVAAGNNAVNACSMSPASASKVVTVGATDHLDAIADFSNFGKCVDIFAPGKNILSTAKGGGTNLFQGTSQSTPIVSGLAAVLLSNHGSMTNDEVVSTIKKTALKGVVTGLPPGNESPNLLAHLQCGDHVPPIEQSSGSITDEVADFITGDDEDSGGKTLGGFPLYAIVLIAVLGALSLVFVLALIVYVSRRG